MRIVAGNLGGQVFDSPKGNRTHPMSEKARGGMFGVLGDIHGLSLLDAFAGSGALGFEAISRGAKSVVAIDVDKKAVESIKKNAKNLQISHQIKTVRANASGWSDNNPQKLFDLIFCDPPYDQPQLNLVVKLLKHLTEGGIVVLSQSKSHSVVDFAGLRILKQKHYGDALLVFYRKIS